MSRLAAVLNQQKELTMKYLVTVIETTEHVLEVEANSECLARSTAVYGWQQGWFVDPCARLVDLEAVSINIIPEEDVA